MKAALFSSLLGPTRPRRAVMVNEDQIGRLDECKVQALFIQ